MDSSASSPVTHNVYTTGSGGDGVGGGSSAMLPAIMAAMMGGNKAEHHHHHGGQQDSSLGHALTAAAAGLGNRGYGAGHAGVGAAAGGAIGFVLGALLNGGNGGGLFGGNRNNDAGNLVTTTELNTALNAQTSNQNTNAILQQLAAIAVAIPENEGKVQLAIAQSQNALQNQGNQNSLMALQGMAGINQNVAGATATIIASESAVKDTVNASAAATSLGIAGLGTLAQQLAAGLSLQGAQQTATIQTAIRDDGDKTRSLIIAQNDATLNRIIVEQANAIIELKSQHAISANGLNVSQTVNQVQAQSQAQQQQQQQFAILSNIAASLSGLTQIAHATNQNVIAGNAGAVTTGAQSANPVNVA